MGTRGNEMLKKWMSKMYMELMDNGELEEYLGTDPDRFHRRLPVLCSHVGTPTLCMFCRLGEARVCQTHQNTDERMDEITPDTVSHIPEKRNNK